MVETLAADLLTTGAAARRLGISSQHVHRLIRAGRIPAISTPLGRLVDPHDCDAWAATRRAPATDSERRHVAV